MAKSFDLLLLSLFGLVALNCAVSQYSSKKRCGQLGLSVRDCGGRYCPVTCGNYQRRRRSCFTNSYCQHNCICKPGAVKLRDNSNVCVRPSQCPKRTRFDDGAYDGGGNTRDVRSPNSDRNRSSRGGWTRSRAPSRAPVTRTTINRAARNSRRYTARTSRYRR